VKWVLLLPPCRGKGGMGLEQWIRSAFTPTLMRQLAIRLSWQTTPAKSLVITLPLKGGGDDSLPLDECPISMDNLSGTAVAQTPLIVFMTNRKMCRLLNLLLVLPLVACNSPMSEISKNIARDFESSSGKSVNLAEAVAGSWETVCILGPYMNNDTAKTTLGFEWDVESKTSITSNEGISLLLFVQDGKVIDYAEHPRNQGDFSNLTMKCFPKENAVFIQDPSPKKGWSGLFNKNEA